MATDTAVRPRIGTPVETTKGPTIPGLLLRAVAWLALAWFVVLWLAGDEEIAGRAADAVIFAMVGLSLNILIGYTGQLSLGHQGFFGIGAFGAAYSLTVRGVPFAGTIAIAAAAGALFALALGVVALRITGLYLALITLVFGLTLEQSLFQVGWLTNKGAGQEAFRPEYLLDLNRFYWLCLAILAVIVYLDWRLTRTKTGRALLALKENERVAAAFGINVTSFKLLAFVLSGAIAGVAGALFAYRSEVANGDDFDFFLALTFVLMTVVGGLGSRVGVIIGSAFFASLDYLLETVPGVEDVIHKLFADDKIQAAPRIIGALLLLTTLIFNPGGIAQQLAPITRWMSGKKFTLHHEKESGPGAVEGSGARA